jgi:RNA polymerase sigma factor (sigma-70 family)
MEATSIEAARIANASQKGSRSRAPASDERLVKRIRSGSEEAFGALYERYHARLLSFCRHMLGSHAEAEDAVQQCFVNAYRDIMRGEKQLRVRPWLYRIARNQCLSALRARRFDSELAADRISLRGLADEVLERADLRDLLRDLAHLPDDQREALVLAELEDNSHAEVAQILGCDREKVKSLVFQARSSLLKSKEARALPCAEVQRQLSVLRGGSLRRTQLRRHLAECPACRAFKEEVKRQRAALALVLPVAPTASLKLAAPTVLTAAKTATGIAAGGAASSGVAAGSTATLAAKLGLSGSAIKGAVAAVAVTAAVGGVAGVEVVTHPSRHESPASRHVRGPVATPRALETSQPRPNSPVHLSSPGRRGRVPAARARVRKPREAEAIKGVHGNESPRLGNRRGDGELPNRAGRQDGGQGRGPGRQGHSPESSGDGPRVLPELPRSPGRRDGARPVQSPRGDHSGPDASAQDGNPLRSTD